MRNIKHHKAFTLVEILIAMSLTVLVGGILFLLQSTGMSTVRKGTSQLIMTSEVRNKMELISSDIRTARDVLEVRPNYLRLRTYKHSSDAYYTGDSALVTVTYELEKTENRDILWRTVGRNNPVRLIYLESIDEQIFTPYFEYPDRESPTGWRFFPFNMDVNDSVQRNRISFFRLRLRFKHMNETAVLDTSVHMRPASSIIRQPNWKFR